MDRKLIGTRVAILVADGFEETEFTRPFAALKEAHALVDVISLKKGQVKSWNNKNWGGEYEVDKLIEDVSASEYDALLLPGGVMSPDLLRVNEKAVKFCQDFFHEGKPIAAICHGPWTLIETGELSGRTMTSYPSIRTDLENAGVNWLDEKVVSDNGLVTSRKPADLDTFCEKMVEEFAVGPRKGRTVFS
jgi:protease I